jgi:hypothetical protein
MNHEELAQWARLKKLSYQLEEVHTDVSAEITEVVQKLRIELPNLNDRKTAAQILRRHYSESVLLKNGWPKEFAMIHDEAVQEGLRMKSLTGAYEGRTTGSRSKCSAKGCPGWFIGILWESGDQTYLCSQGWHYDAENQELEIIGGGEITGRFVTPREILPRSEWPTRESLLQRKGWRINP